MMSFQFAGKFSLLSVAGLAALGVAALASGGGAQSQPKEALAGQAGEVLARRCLSCHNAEKKTGGLDLSARSAGLGALTPGKPEKSRAMIRVAQGTMPPTGKLPDTEIALLRRWIQSGAAYPQARLEPFDPAKKSLWSFQPVRRPSLPKTRFDALARNPVDRFVFAELAKKGLKPSPLAGKPALLRRVTIDLTGLPPTPQEVAAFLADKSPNAYEKVVDRLLASPAYGERWGRHWLDVARFGESHGYEQNHLRENAWPYRDYVIRAFNEDKPYTEFIAEQLAGDIVGKGDPAREIGTGFLVAGIHDTVGIQEELGTRQQRANDLEDIVTTTGMTFLGLTVGCAKCHDHKFDPIPQRDFYRMAAVFSDVRHGERKLSPRPLPPDQAHELEEKKREMDTARQEIAALDRQALNLPPVAPGAALRSPVSPQRNVEEFAPVRARFARFTVLATSDGAEPCLDELRVYGPDSAANLAEARQGGQASASSLLPGYAIHQVAHLNDGKFGNANSWISQEKGGGWAQIALPQTATVNKILWARDAHNDFKDRLPVVYEISVSEDGRSWKTVASGSDRATDPHTPPGAAALQRMTPEQRERRKTLVSRAQELQKRVTRLSPEQSAYVGQFGAPEAVYLLQRGDVMQRGEQVAPGALSQIPALSAELSGPAAQRQGHRPGRSSPGVQSGHQSSRSISPGLKTRTAGGKPPEGGYTKAGPMKDPSGWSAASRPRGRNTLKLSPLSVSERSGAASVLVQALAGRGNPPALENQPRLALARWIGNPANPLTARVLVNRLWGQHFGRGLAGTPSDFGNNGEKPSHPELLDWLARDFMAHGWKIKRMHRLMVTSHTYRQASAANPQGMAKDADNRLLWRMPLRRMEAEAVRDAILATSGKLNRKMGGPGFRLYKYEVVNVAIYTPQEEHGPETWRRSVYHQSARGIRDSLLGSFDCPDSSERAAKRSSTTTALQALSLLNGHFVAQQADFFAERVRKEAGQKPGAQVERAFRLAFGRPPPPEAQGARSLVVQHGLPTLCRALLNANPFLYY